MVSVLFVCMGNICRSPMAEGVFRQLIEDEGKSASFQIDSAGTIGFHAGSPPDRRAQQTARSNGVDISAQRSRKVIEQDFYRFDYILAMDNDNFHDLTDMKPADSNAEVSLFLSHAANTARTEMPDPYYGGADNFDHCFEMAQDAAHGLLAHISETQSTA